MKDLKLTKAEENLYWNILLYGIESEVDEPRANIESGV